VSLLKTITTFLPIKTLMGKWWAGFATKQNNMIIYKQPLAAMQ
jgi:hypothetical protein